MNAKFPSLPPTSLLIPGKTTPSYKFHLYMAAEGAPAEPIPDSQGLVDLQTELIRLSNENQKKMIELETHISNLTKWLKKKQDLSSLNSSSSSSSSSSSNSSLASSHSTSSSSLLSSSHMSSLKENHRSRSPSLTSQSSLLKRDSNSSDVSYPSGKRRKSEQGFLLPSTSSVPSFSSLNVPSAATLLPSNISSSVMEIAPSSALIPTTIASFSILPSQNSSQTSSVQYSSSSSIFQTKDSIPSSSNSVSSFPIQGYSERSTKETFETISGASYQEPSSVHSKHSSVSRIVGDLSESSLIPSSLPPSSFSSFSSSSSSFSHPVTLNSSLSSSNSSVTLSSLNSSLSLSTSSLSSSSSGSGPKIKFKLDEFVKLKPDFKPSLSNSEVSPTSFPLDQEVSLNDSTFVNPSTLFHGSSMPSHAIASMSSRSSLSHTEFVPSAQSELELDAQRPLALPSHLESGSTSISALHTSSSPSSLLPSLPVTTMGHQVSSHSTSLVDASISDFNPSNANRVDPTASTGSTYSVSSTITTSTTTLSVPPPPVPRVPQPPSNLSKNETFIFYHDRAYYYENFLTQDSLTTMTEILKGEDFSKITKLGQQIPITTFWSYMEPFFRPLTEDDLHILKWKDDSEYAMYFKIPTLGSHPNMISSQAYYEALSQSTWQVQQALGLSATSMPSSLASWSLGHRHAVPLKTRMMACLLPELPHPTTSSSTSSSSSHGSDSIAISDSIKAKENDALQLHSNKQTTSDLSVEVPTVNESTVLDASTLAPSSLDSNSTSLGSHRENDQNGDGKSTFDEKTTALSVPIPGSSDPHPSEEPSLVTEETSLKMEIEGLENSEIKVNTTHLQYDPEIDLSDTNDVTNPHPGQSIILVQEAEPMEQTQADLTSLHDDVPSLVSFNDASNSTSSLPSSLLSSSLNSSISSVSLLSPSPSTRFPHPTQPLRHPASTYLGDPTDPSADHRSSDEDDSEDDEDGASHMDDSTQEETLLDHVDVLNNTQDMEQLNERLKAELRSLGLWDTSIPPPPPPSADSSSCSMTIANEEDDMISVALRHHQSLLQEQCKINRHRQKQLLHLAYQYLGYQEYLHLLIDVNRQLEKAFQFKFGKPNVHTKKSKKSKPSSSNTSSSTSSSTSLIHSFSTIEDPITGVSDSVVALIQHRHQLVQTIGRVFQGREHEFWKTPQVSIFTGWDKNVQLPD